MVKKLSLAVDVYKLHVIDISEIPSGIVVNFTFLEHIKRQHIFQMCFACELISRIQYRTVFC